MSRGLSSVTGCKNGEVCFIDVRRGTGGMGAPCQKLAVCNRTEFICFVQCTIATKQRYV